MRVSLLLLGSVWLVSGCATHAVLPQSTAAVPRLERSAPVYVRLPEDGQYYEGKPYAGSGGMAARSVREGLVGFAGSLSGGSVPENRAAAIESAREAMATYVFFPEVMHWEDRATEWSGRPDRLELAIVVIDVETGNALLETTITAKSSWFTLGGDHPQDMLRVPVREFISSLYAE